MNLLLELIIEKGLLLDIFGVIGLGLVALAAINFAKRWNSTGGSIMAGGAIALLLGRIGALILGYYLTPYNQGQFDPTLLAIGKSIPLVLLTAGLGAVVWGLWGHERQLAGQTLSD